jgi:alpha-methylacyl-CoA racemase
MEGTDVCFAPVLSMDEAPRHPHNLARNSFIEADGVTQPAPAPRFSRSQPGFPTAPRLAGSDTNAVLRDAGYSEAQVAELRALGILT